MTVVDQKVSAKAGVALKKLDGKITTAISQTDVITDLRQIQHPFVVQGVNAYCSALAGAVSIKVGILRPGKVLQAVTLAIGGTKSKFKISVAIDALAPHLPALPCTDGYRHLIHKAITDNLPFSSAFTVNAAAATGTFYACVRVQMADDWSAAETADYTVSTKVKAADQAYTTAADALANCPAADTDKVDLGVIKIRVVDVTFTAKTTLLDASGVTTTFTGITAAGLVQCLSGALAYATAQNVSATTYVPSGTNTSAMTQYQKDRAVNQAGGLLVISYTSDGSGALTNGGYSVDYRVFPAAGEAVVRGA